MAWHSHRRRIPPKHPSQQPSLILLDQFSSGDIHRWKDLKDKFLKFHWDYYSNLVYQRSKVADKINSALFEAAESKFLFKNWQRTLKHKYSTEPLSVEGSLVDPGGRFNIGDINPSQFPCFPALYVAADKDTSLQELLSQKIDPGRENRALDFALANPASITHISLSGSLDSIIDLKKPEKLHSFVDLIKDFSIPEHLKQTAKMIGLSSLELIQTVPKLEDALLSPHWREWPIQFDVPVTSQIFGQLVVEAGIEGILYTSKFSGHDCLAIFPQNFDEDSGSFVQLDDAAPKETQIHRWDAKTWNEYQKSK